MTLRLYKYHGAGNDFLLADNRKGGITLDKEQISRLCDRHIGLGADGLMLLGLQESDEGDSKVKLLTRSHDKADFVMEYYNSDGSGGMMCGNGARCIVAFANDLGVVPGGESGDGESPVKYRFLAPDGLHEAEIIESDGCVKTVRLKMQDVDKVEQLGDGSMFLNTGTVHLVRFVEDAGNVAVTEEGPVYRYDSMFAPVGCNVNFVEVCDDKDETGASAEHFQALENACDNETMSKIKVRTYEKGVEDETLACGTGIVASALASYVSSSRHSGDVEHTTRVQARIAELEVAFHVNHRESGVGEHGGAIMPYSFDNVFLTGPAEYVAEISVNV